MTRLAFSGTATLAKQHILRMSSSFRQRQLRASTWESTGSRAKFQFFHRHLHDRDRARCRIHHSPRHQRLSLEHYQNRDPLPRTSSIVDSCSTERRTAWGDRALHLSGSSASRGPLRNTLLWPPGKLNTSPASQWYGNNIFRKPRPSQSISADLTKARTDQTGFNHVHSKNQDNPPSLTRSRALGARGIRTLCLLLHILSSQRVGPIERSRHAPRTRKEN